jgi:uncharacterized protein
MQMKRLHILAATAAVASAAILATAAPASAHVTVSSPGAAQGGYAVLTFAVPTESATASTTGLQVQFPTDTPIASVLVKPHPGWSARTVTSRLAKPIKTDDGDTITDAVTEIVWTADSAATAIEPGQFDQFLVSAGPLPKVDTLRFAAIQTYSDGSVVNWNETAAAGSTVAPDHPKPSLSLAKAGTTVTAATPTVTASAPSNTGPIVLSIVALVVAAAALGLAVVSRARGSGD